MMKLALRMQHLAILLLAALAAVAASSDLPHHAREASRHTIDGSADVSTDKQSALSSLISIPLIPDHVHRRRLLAKHNDEEGHHRDRHLDGVAETHEYSADQVGALYQGYGTHYVDLWCGTPPQRQTVIVDTGSRYTAFPCTGCDDCGVPKYHIDALFEPKDSSTFHQTSCSEDGCTFAQISACPSSADTLDQCLFGAAYAEKSRWEAYEAVDVCYIGGLHNNGLAVSSSVFTALQPTDVDDLDPSSAKHMAIHLAFGCQTVATRLFKTQLADGIMGMANGNKGATYWEQLQRAGKMTDHKLQFALCFARKPSAHREGTEAGAMTIGGSDPRLRNDDYKSMVYSSRAADGGRAGYFSMRARAVYLRESAAGDSAISKHVGDPTQGVYKLDVSETKLNSGGIIVDSGTTLTFWHTNLQASFRKKFKEMTGVTFIDGSPIKLTAQQYQSLPTIIFQFVGDADAVKAMHGESADPNQIPGLAGDLDPDHPYDIIMAFPPSHYMEYYPKDDEYESAFVLTRNTKSVVGASMMMGHDILFDIENNRIGVAESHCDLTRTLKDNGLPSVFDDDATSQQQQSGNASIKIEDEYPEKKKDKPNDGIDNTDKKADHDQPAGNDPSSAPPNKKKTDGTFDLDDFMANCDNTCRGILIGLAAVFIPCFLCCLYRVYCSKSENPYAQVGTGSVVAACDPDEEIELPQMGGNGFSSYRDQPIDDDDYIPDDEMNG